MVETVASATLGMGTCLIEVHVEDWDSALKHPIDWQPTLSDIIEPTIKRLFEVFEEYKVTANFYYLGVVADKAPYLVRETILRQHGIGSHGYWHRHHEYEGDHSDKYARRFLPECTGYRSPFWDTTKRPSYAGGIFFRLMPVKWIVWQARKHGVLWLHPHDLEPRYGPWWRRVHYQEPWQKLRQVLDGIR